MRATAVEQALVGQPATAEAVKAACAAGCRRHQPADRHQRRRRLPSSPGRRTHRPWRVARSSRQAESSCGADAPVHGARADRRRLGSVQRPRADRAVLPRRLADVVRRRGLRGPRARSSSDRSRCSTPARAASSSATRRPHRAVIEAKGKDKRGNGTAAANVTATLDRGRRRRDRGDGQDRPQHHRQAGPVRPRRDAGRQRQAARPVRVLPRDQARSGHR